MTDAEYLREMFDLTIKLTDACNNFGIRSDAYNAVLKEIAVSAARFNRSRRLWSWVMIIVLSFILWLVAWVVFWILLPFAMPSILG